MTFIFLDVVSSKNVTVNSDYQEQHTIVQLIQFPQRQHLETRSLYTDGHLDYGRMTMITGKRLGWYSEYESKSERGTGIDWMAGSGNGKGDGYYTDLGNGCGNSRFLRRLP